MQNKITFGGLMAILLLSLFMVVNFAGPGGYRKLMIDGDGSGLYAYLPAIFIYKSIDFTPVFENEKLRRPPDYMGHNYHRVHGKLINKFSCGTALLELPFFLIAWLLSLLLGLPADGFNILFQYATAISALFWVWVGLYYFVQLTSLYGIKKKNAWLTAFCGLLATNLLFYTLITPSASHAYSFALISIFLYFMKKAFLNHDKRPMYVSSFILGLIVLVRPVNILVVAALPFLSGSSGSFFLVVKDKLIKGGILWLMFLFFLGLAPQLVINYLQTGNLFVYGYQNEGFYFLKPEWISFLFSYRKGWFVYTPFMLLLIPGVIMLYKRSRYEFYSFLGFLVLLIYMFSSWWNWFYGDSFGMRPMVDYYSLFFLLITLLFTSIQRRRFTVILYLFTGLTIVLNLLQTYQYAKGIIHPDSMNKEAYRKVFLKTSEKYKGIIGATDESFYGTLAARPFFSTENDMENSYRGWSLPDKTDNRAFSGSGSVRMDSSVIYSPTLSYQIPDSLTGKKNLYVLFEALIMELQPNSTTKALFVVDISNETGETLFYKKFKVKKLPDEVTGEWRREHIGFKLPEIAPEMANIRLYIWNLKHTDFLVDDMRITFFTYH